LLNEDQTFDAFPKRKCFLQDKIIVTIIIIRKIVRATRIPPTIKIQCSALDPRFTLAAKKIAVRRWSGLVGSANYFSPNTNNNEYELY
jgi:hypothetical protein